MGTPTGHPGPYLALPLPLQVHHAHVHNGPQVGEGFHGDHIGALLIAVHIELRRKNKVSPAARLADPEESVFTQTPSLCARRGLRCEGDC